MYVIQFLPALLYKSLRGEEQEKNGSVQLTKENVSVFLLCTLVALVAESDIVIGRSVLLFRKGKRARALRCSAFINDDRDGG
jgi:hypothetical protein